MSRIQFSLSKVINMHCKNILECVTRRWLATFKCGYTVCSAVILYHIAMRRRDIKRSKAVCFVSRRRKRRIDEDMLGNMASYSIVIIIVIVIIVTLRFELLTRTAN